MNKPYENSENIVLNQSDITEIIGKLNSHVKSSDDPAQALYRLLEYEDDFPFTIDDCRMAINSGSIYGKMLSMAMYKHYHGAIKRRINYYPPIDKYDPSEKPRIQSIDDILINQSFILRQYNRLKFLLFRKQKNTR